MTVLQQVADKRITDGILLCRKCYEQEPRTMLCEGEYPCYGENDVVITRPCQKLLLRKEEARKDRRASDAGVTPKLLQAVAQSRTEPILVEGVYHTSLSATTSRRMIATIAHLINENRTCRWIDVPTLYSKDMDEQRSVVDASHEVEFLFVDRLDAQGGTNEIRAKILDVVRSRAIGFKWTVATTGKVSLHRNEDEEEFFEEVKTWEKLPS